MRIPEGNMVIRVSKCIGDALSMKRKSKESKDHWLDHAEAKHGKKLVNDVKDLLKVLFLYLPLPVFWALFDQQGSGWTFQARMMTGDIGFYTILPDQMQVVNPLLILIFIPIFQYIVYPVFNKLRILRTPLQRLVAGGSFAAVSFFISAIISLVLEGKLPVQPSSGIGHLRIYNTMPCTLQFDTTASFGNVVISPNGYYENMDIVVEGTKTFTYTYRCEDGSYENTGEFRVVENEALGYYFPSPNTLMEITDSNEKDDNNGYPKIRTLVNTMDNDLSRYYIRYYDGIRHLHQKLILNDTTVFDFPPGDMYVWVGNTELYFEPKLGGVYVVMATFNRTTLFDMDFIEVTPPNDVHMLLQLPQYIIITMGEIMFSITGLEFAYSQAPTSMKSVVQAGWLLTTAFGNLLVVIIEALQSFEEESSAFFLYASLMVADMALFAFMAYRYTYIERKSDDDEEGTEEARANQHSGIENSGLNRDE